MKIYQALKLKNRIASEIKELENIVRQNNSVQESAVRRFDVKSSMSEIDKRRKELIDLKDRINKANVPIFSKILYLGEMKAQAAFIKSISTSESISHYSSGPIKNTVIFNALESRAMLRECEDLIEKIQEEIDVFNSETSI